MRLIDGMIGEGGPEGDGESEDVSTHRGVRSFRRNLGLTKQRNDAVAEFVGVKDPNASFFPGRMVRTTDAVDFEMSNAILCDWLEEVDRSDRVRRRVRGDATAV